MNPTNRLQPGDDIPEPETDQPEPGELDPAAQADDGEDPPPEFYEDDTAGDVETA